MMKSANLIFFGNERLSTGFTPQGAPTLQALILAGYTVSAVVANYEKGNSRNARQLEVEAVAKKYHIPLLLPSSPNSIQQQLAGYKPAVGVLVAYGKLISQSIIDVFPHGIVNIHPSLLPAYRGPTPIEQAILDGAPKTGVSLMQLVKKMDAGPVYAQREVNLQGSESKKHLTDQLLQHGKNLLIETLPHILSGTLTPLPQDEQNATYTSLIKKSDGIMDLRKPAKQLEREVRAYNGWPKSKATMLGHDIVVTKVRIAEDESDGALTITCDPGWLEILELIAPSGRTMTGIDFLRGYGKR